MSFIGAVRRARDLLREEGRISLRALRREFDLDDEALDELVEELVDVQQVAAREGNVLAWAGASAAPSSVPPAPAQPDRPLRDDTLQLSVLNIHPRPRTS